MKKSRLIHLKKTIKELDNINNDYKIYFNFYIPLYNRSLSLSP